jgi:4-diphosphocytidyl-2-C-methyl-D-erythritol kinase
VQSEGNPIVAEDTFRVGGCRVILKPWRMLLVCLAAVGRALDVCLMLVRNIAGGVEVLAPAKLNLFLEVLGRRPDGYHEIESLMVAVSLYDTLTVHDDPTGAISLRCSDPTLPSGSDNLVMKAADRLKAATGSARGARMVLTKSIPAQGGLAGGSSDAAATLAALKQLWKLDISAQRMHGIAAELGSDVPFFQQAPAACCRGRGEQVESVPLINPYHFVLVCPPAGVSTADVYARVVPPRKPQPLQPVLEALATGRPAELGKTLFNRLQPIAEALRPELNRVRNALANLGPLLDGSSMTGSGSAYFGLCRTLAAARRAADVLEPLGLGCVRVVSCGPPAANAS